MDSYLLANIIACAFAFVGFVYGAILFFRPRKALYGQMITFALLCIVIGRLFNISRLISGGEFVGRFQLGTLAIIGSFMFFFSSNYGALDSIVDDGTKAFRKYRLIALIAPAVMLALYFSIFYMSNISDMWKVQGAVILLFAALCSYYHLKHLFIPDVDFGVVRTLRPYNFLALCYMFSSIAECYALSRDDAGLTLITCCFSAVFTCVMIPFIAFGLKRSRT